MQAFRTKAAAAAARLQEEAARLQEGAQARVSAAREGGAFRLSGRQRVPEQDGGAAGSPASSEGDNTTERARLVDDDDDAGSTVSSTVSSAVGNWVGGFLDGRARELISSRLEGAGRVVGSAADSAKHRLGEARTIGAKGVGTVATAASSGKQAFKSAAADARGRCGEAIGAAAAMGGAALPLGQTQKEPEALDRLCACCPPLTFKQRVVGCFACLVLGAVLSLGSLGSTVQARVRSNSPPSAPAPAPALHPRPTLATYSPHPRYLFAPPSQLFLGNPTPFAFKYTLGNLLSLGSTTFLVGPKRQCDAGPHIVHQGLPNPRRAPSLGAPPILRAACGTGAATCSRRRAASPRSRTL